MNNNNSLLRHIPWLALAVIGACALGVVALRRGEAINALWIVVAAVAIYLVAYRYYSLFIATKVMQLDPRRATPAVLNNDGLDYVPTNKHILFGHHFAAIAGAGPLVGPVLAAQMGYLPGTLWLIAGVVLAGAVQDFMVLFMSTRRNGRSLGDMVREEMGRIPGTIALFGCFLIMIIILAVLALIVVKALAESPWGMFTVMATIPIAMFMGIYMRYIRPGRIGEISVVGVVLLLASIWLGGVIAADPVWGPAFTFTGVQITWMLVGYGFVAAVLPVWLVLAPRDYLSTFLKIGTIVGLAIGILIIAPELKMPALTQFTDGTGPVWKGTLFPFLFITIACGAVSGFHALISSGTTPKLLDNETNARYIGYGGMLMESFVAIMAMVAASVIEPGVYFAMNSPAAVVGADVASVAQTVSSWGFLITPEQLEAVARDIGEHTILARAGGAPTLAVGIAQILHQVLPGENTMAFWYHFAILFEALFILTAVDAGTRAGRFMLQDLLGSFVPALKRTESWGANLLATAGCVAMWGYLLYQGVIDPLGGINTLWPLFGISNQMLAGIALMLG
ncbi:MAG: carbon starvation CstA family protein, partial [Pseudomonas putida]